MLPIPFTNKSQSLKFDEKFHKNC